jgi:hypothetical protein
MVHLPSLKIRWEVISEVHALLVLFQEENYSAHWTDAWVNWTAIVGMVVGTWTLMGRMVASIQLIF